MSDKEDDYDEEGMDRIEEVFKLMGKPKSKPFLP